MCSDSADLKLVFFAWVFFPPFQRNALLPFLFRSSSLGLLLLILLVFHTAGLSDSGLHAELLPKT
jgi:hypothetical protein